MYIRKTFYEYAVLMLIAALLCTPLYPLFAEEIESNSEISEAVSSTTGTDEELQTEQTENDSGETETEAVEETNTPEDPNLIQGSENQENDSEISGDTQTNESLEESEPIDEPVDTDTDVSVEEDTAASSTEIATTSASTIATSTEEDDEVEDEAGVVVATGTPEIVTGNAVALANIMNLVNTNFINSDGVVLFDNFFENLVGGLDFREMYNSIADFGCSLVSCDGDDVTSNVTNDAYIRNALLIEALTGRNTIEGGTTSTIQTGNAYAGLNLINIANTNIIDSNYLLVTLNAFHDVNGDIVFPSLSNFFGGIAGGTSADAINVVNTGEIVNSVDVTANTGANTTEGQGAITTGSSAASTNVFNQLNTSLIGGQSVSILFRVHGNWAGEIFGAPPNLGWMEDGNGGIYLFDTGSSGGGGGNYTVNATNTALIENDVQVVALTGENAITGAETSLITTGNAYAGANIMNVANATVVGRNWILAVINILGDFTGNIAFGRPDLWVGAKVDVPRTIKNGSELTYTLTVINNGDSPATNIRLTEDYDEAHLEIQDASHTFEAQDGTLVWTLGELPPGMATEVTYTARIVDAPPGTEIENMSSVRGRETDNNMSDNKDMIAVTTDRPSDGGVRINLSKSKPNVEEDILEKVDVSVLSVDRTTGSTKLTGNEAAHATQTLVVTNNSNKKILNAILHDIMVDPHGATVSDEVWELGDILPHEEITLTYNIQFAENASSGTYVLKTTLQGSNLESLLSEENGQIVLFKLGVPLDVLAPTGAATFYGPQPAVLGATHTDPILTEEPSIVSSILPLVIPTAYAAAARTDHGLPMTHVPYRYSMYLFFLAIALSNLYYMARRQQNDIAEE